MKGSPGRRPLEVTFAFILAVTLLLPGVTSRFIASTATTSPDMARSPDHDIAINKTETADLEEPPLDNNGTGANDEVDEDDALALFSLLVKRAVDEEMTDESEEDESETTSVDEDKFSISDLPKLLKPLIDAFSDQSSSDAPSKDDFLSWFPSLKDLFEPKKPRGTEATTSATRPGRRSSFSATQPTEPEILPSSQPDAYIATVTTIIRPPITIPTRRPITINPTDNSDSDKDSETNF